jgi:hypothetical protein
LISRADLEAETGRSATIAPAGGQVLFIKLVRREALSDDNIVVRETLGLPRELTPGTSLAVSGAVRYEQVEEEGTIETGDTLEGTLTVDPATKAFALTLDAHDIFREMFSEDAALHHQVVSPLRIHSTRKCK